MICTINSLCEDLSEAGLESRVFNGLDSCCVKLHGLLQGFRFLCPSSGLVKPISIWFFSFSFRTVILSDGPCTRFWVVIMGFIAFLKTQFIVHLLIGFVFVVSGLIINFIQLCTLVLWPINKQFYRRVNCRLAYSLWSREYTSRGWEGWGLGGEWFLFLFFLIKEKDIHTCIQTQIREISDKFFQSGSKQPSFLKYWENIQQSREWSILFLCYSKKWEAKAPTLTLYWLVGIADSVSVPSWSSVRACAKWWERGNLQILLQVQSICAILNTSLGALRRLWSLQRDAYLKVPSVDASIAELRQLL